MDKTKHQTIRKLTDGSPCCVCTNGIPAYEVVYPVLDGGATRLERYCSTCINKVFSRNAVSNRHKYRLVVTKTKRKPKQPRLNFDDRNTRILVNRIDLCNDELPKEADNIQYRINVLDEIDDSFESEYDKHEPRLLLCSFCKKEYNIPSYLP